MEQPTFVQRLLEAAGEIWAGYHTHPFVQGIGDGTLPVDKFRRYLIQDYRYLADYARVFAIGTAKGGSLAAMGEYAGYVHQILHGEMDIHRSYMARLGITQEEAEGAAPALDTISYTSYMLRVAYEGDEGAAAVAVLACALSYEVIARRLVERFPGCDRHPFYGEWVRGYAGEEYHRGNLALIALTEQLAQGRSGAQLDKLEEIFLICSRYEAAFWDMAWKEGC